ncbi:MAG: GreA/GreB family elongation factor [Spirochaetes bacterium]|nr:GreA/GreB family elongation factor [Spirochaetota bacterium]
MRTSKVLSSHDCERLLQLIHGTEPMPPDSAGIEMLRDSIERAKQVKPKKIKPNIVTMNSVFTLKDIGNGSKETYSLVFPDDSDMKKNRISVFSGIGAQLLGCAVGTVIRGMGRLDQYLLIEELVYQPEAAGDYDH